MHVIDYLWTAFIQVSDSENGPSFGLFFVFIPKTLRFYETYVAIFTSLCFQIQNILFASENGCLMLAIYRWKRIYLNHRYFMRTSGWTAAHGDHGHCNFEYVFASTGTLKPKQLIVITN
jgi:hypothetical protein